MPASVRKERARATLIQREGDLCLWCGTLMTRERDHPHEMTLDHLRPKEHGGSWRMPNLALACRRCNSERHSKSPHQYVLELRQQNVNPRVDALIRRLELMIAHERELESLPWATEQLHLLRHL